MRVRVRDDHPASVVVGRKVCEGGARAQIGHRHDFVAPLVPPLHGDHPSFLILVPKQKYLAYNESESCLNFNDVNLKYVKEVMD